jgi:sugar diacid utilization regulator
MQRVRESVLGPVLALAGEERSLLLATLAAWRDNRGSTDATSRQILSPNTVRLRLRRPRGHSLTVDSGATKLIDDSLAWLEKHHLH